jgi:hypothetical protein
MALTPAQNTTLKSAITANPTWAAFPMTNDGYFDLAAALNVEASPNFFVWATNADVQAIRSRITWANLTPADVPDGTATWTNRALQCQGKQFALQLILPMTGTFSGVDVDIRAGLQDALQGIRSGAGGVSQGANWTGVRDALTRKAKFCEQILADTSGGQNGSTRALSATMGFEGTLSSEDVRLARI